MRANQINMRVQKHERVCALVLGCSKAPYCVLGVMIEACECAAAWDAIDAVVLALSDYHFPQSVHGKKVTTVKLRQGGTRCRGVTGQSLLP